MIKEKKKVLSVIAVCIVMAIIVFIIILNNMPLRLLEIKPDNIPIKISVYSKESVLKSFFFHLFVWDSLLIMILL